MSKTLTLSTSAIVSGTLNGAAVDILNPPFSRSITVDNDASLYTVTLAGAAAAVNILPPNWAAGDQLIFLPIYNDQAGSLSESVDINMTVTGPTTDDWTIGFISGVKLPASVTALTADNNDASNSVDLQILHIRKSS